MLQSPASRVWQLFVNGEMWTPARWPNAIFSDRTVFNWSHWGSFNTSAPWGPFPKPVVPSKPISFHDRGGASGLAQSGINATDAVFIGNIAHDDTFTGVVSSHNAGQNNFDVSLNVDFMGNTKVGNSIYFLEGKSEFVDMATEWAYDVPSRKLTIKTPPGPLCHDCTNWILNHSSNYLTNDLRIPCISNPLHDISKPYSHANLAGVSPTTLIFRHKVKTYAMNITNSKHFTLANMTFFGTTLHAAGGIPFLRLESLQMLHPSFPKRMLGVTHTAAPTVLSEIDGDLLRQVDTYSSVDQSQLRKVDSYSSVDQSQLDGETKMGGNFRGHPNPTPAGSSFTVYNCTW